MTEVADIPAGRGPDLTLDMCRTCHFVWFDPGEFDRLPKKQPIAEPTAPRELSAEAKNIVALHEMERIDRDARGPMLQETAQGPEEAWQWIPGLLGLPVQYDAETVARPPLITWCVMGLLAAVGLLALGNLERVVETLGFIPAEAFRYGGFTFLSTFFIHGGIAHLLVNLYFLFTFGDNVEDLLGKLRYVVLIVLATLAGTVAHALSDTSSMIPLVGASGGISGVLAFYALSFPTARIGLTHWRVHGFYPRGLLNMGSMAHSGRSSTQYGGRWLCIPVWLAFVLWIALQAVGAWQQVLGWSHVSAFSHIGGTVAGFILWLIWRHQDVGNAHGFTVASSSAFPRTGAGK